jgi:hypothetical protein
MAHATCFLPWARMVSTKKRASSGLWHSSHASWRTTLALPPSCPSGSGSGTSLGAHRHSAAGPSADSKHSRTIELFSTGSHRLPLFGRRSVVSMADHLKHADLLAKVLERRLADAKKGPVALGFHTPCLFFLSTHLYWRTDLPVVGEGSEPPTGPIPATATQRRTCCVCGSAAMFHCGSCNNARSSHQTCSTCMFLTSVQVLQSRVPSPPLARTQRASQWLPPQARRPFAFASSLSRRPGRWEYKGPFLRVYHIHEVLASFQIPRGPAQELSRQDGPC